MFAGLLESNFFVLRHSMGLKGIKENQEETYKSTMPSKRLSVHSSSASNRAFRNEQMTHFIQPATKNVFEKTPGSFSFRSSPSMIHHVKQIKPDFFENNSSIQLLDKKFKDKLVLNESEDENGDDHNTNAYSSCGDIVVENLNESAKHAIQSSNKIIDEAETKLPVKRIISTKLPRDFSNSVSSTTTDDVFYEASPVFNQPTDGGVSTIKYDNFEFRELEKFNSDSSPRYDHMGNSLPVPKFYPTLLVESFYPVVDVDINPHMTCPLISNSTPLDLKSLYKSPSSFMIAPFCDIFDNDEERCEEYSLLNILTEEVALIDSELEVSETSPSVRNVVHGLKEYFKLLFKNEDYEVKYPWTKYLPRSSDDTDEFDKKLEIAREYNLDDCYAYTIF